MSLFTSFIFSLLGRRKLRLLAGLLLAWLGSSARAQSLPTCTAASGCNLLSNPSFEQTDNGVCPTRIGKISARGVADELQAANPDQTTTLLQTAHIACDWFRGNLDGTPDLFNTCAPEPSDPVLFPPGASYPFPSASIPCNHASLCTSNATPTGGQPTRTPGNGYAGLFGYSTASITSGSTTLVEYREYLAHTLTPLAAGTYYGYFYTNIAPRSKVAVPKLGMALSSAAPLSSNTRTAYTGKGPLAAASLTTVVEGSVASTPQAGWNLVEGFFTSAGTGNETQLIIGNFEPARGLTPPGTAGPGNARSTSSYDDAPFNSSAYYYVDDAGLLDMTADSRALTVTCGQAVTLGTLTCALPIDTKATYSWAPTTGLSNPTAATPTLIVSPTTPTLYTLTITIPNGGGQCSIPFHLSAPQAAPPLVITPAFSGALCGGGSIRLTASGSLGAAYTWSPAYGLSATTGTTVVATPAVNTTYTVTNGCQSTSYDVQVNPDGGCCMLANLNVKKTYIELAPKPYVYTTSPFTGPPGTYYYVKGSLRIEGVSCILHPGSTLLMDSGIGSNVELGLGTELQLKGATITAACDDMWGGLVVEGNAVGLAAYRHQSTASLSHSYRGVVLQEPMPGYQPYFTLEEVAFRHNRQSVEVHRITPPTANDFISRCTFDSDPAHFKKPWLATGPSDQHYALRHLAINGDLRLADITDNDFQHSLYGVYSLQEEPMLSSVRLTDNTFHTFYLAGVISLRAPGGRYALTNNTFVFPPGNALPATAQVQDALQDHIKDFPSYGLDGTYGVFLLDANLMATNNRFQQLDSTVTVTMDNYDYFASIRPRQTGILMPGTTSMTVAPVLTDNTFYLLDTGINVLGLYQDSHLDIKGNGLVNCRLGISLRHSAIDAKVFVDSNNPPDPPVTHLTRDPVVNLACNTFRRVDTSSPRSGNTVGVLIPYQPVADRSYLDIVCTSCPPPAYFYPGVILDDPAQVAKNPGTTYMKNWFDDASVPAGSAYFSFENDQPAFTLNYKTYGNNDPFNPIPPGYYSYAQHDYDLSLGSSNIPLGNYVPNVSAQPETATCQYQMPVSFPNAGIQARPAIGGGQPSIPSTNQPTSTNTLTQNWPNPATGMTSFTYQLKAGTRQAELLIRRAIDGREIKQVSLDLHQTSYELILKHWLTGTYFATLMVDGTPTMTRRMVVE